MLRSILNLFLQLLIIFIPSLQLKVNKQPIMIIEAKQFLLRCFIVLEFLLERYRVSALSYVCRSAVMAVSILRQERFYMNTSLMVNNRLNVVLPSTLVAFQFVLFNIDEDLIWKAHVDECIDASFELFEDLCLGSVAWEVCEHESFLGVTGKSQQFQVNPLFVQLIEILIVDHGLNLHVERVGKLL